MRRWEPKIMTAVVVSAILLTVAAGIFAIEYARASNECALQLTPGSCLSDSSLQMWTNGVFASVAGLMVAIVMGITLGVNVHRDPAPNTALARRLAAEDEAYRQA